MKKILTLALALVLVFAIAAPALAITGELPTEDKASEVDFVELDVALFSKEPAITGFGGFQLSSVAANKAYIVNEIAFYGVAIHFVEYDNDEVVPNMPAAEFTGADLLITSDALNLRDVKDVYKVNKNGKVTELAPVVSFDNKENEVLFNNFPAEWGTGSTVYVFGSGVVVAKGVLTAEFAKDAVDLDVAPFSIYDGNELLYTVQKSGLNYFVSDADSNYVQFSTNAKHEVTSISVSLDAGATFQPISYTVPVSGGGTVVEAIGTFKDKDLAEAKAAYEAVMAFFGFDYDAEGVLLDKHFEGKATGLNLKDEAVIQLYTADIVVPGGVTPPKTGDAASIVGFVMIAVAMIAAGVVVSRKVRA